MNNNLIKLSPSSLNLFIECPLCFWLAKKKWIRRPPPYPYSLNAAVDQLLKQEFDEYREKNEAPPIILQNNIPAKLFSDQKLLNEWRNNFKGLRYYDSELKATLFGAVDDVLEFESGALAPLDFKSTGSREPKIYDSFQLQMNVYSYLLEKNGFESIGKGYFAFYIVDKENGFINRLPFKEVLREVEVDSSFVLDVFKKAVMLLRNDDPPKHDKDCNFGKWFQNVKSIIG